MENNDIICLIAFTLLFVALNTLIYLIRSYIVNKPPGMLISLIKPFHICLKSCAIQCLVKSTCFILHLLKITKLKWQALNDVLSFSMKSNVLKITRKVKSFENYISFSYAPTRLTPPVCLYSHLFHLEGWGEAPKKWGCHITLEQCPSQGAAAH